MYHNIIPCLILVTYNFNYCTISLSISVTFLILLNRTYRMLHFTIHRIGPTKLKKIAVYCLTRVKITSKTEQIRPNLWPNTSKRSNLVEIFGRIWSYKIDPIYKQIWTLRNQPNLFVIIGRIWSHEFLYN